MLRLFVGVGFPPELKLHLSLLCSGIPGAKWVDSGNFHLTLRFIGETGEAVAADIDDALARLRAKPELANLSLLRQSRLSVCPVSTGEWTVLCAMAGVPT